VKKRAIHLTLSLDFGGVESHLRLIAEHGGDRFRHDFAAISTGGRVAEQIAALGQKVSIVASDPWAKPLQTLGALHRFHRRERYDVIHCHGAEANIWGLWSARLAGVPIRIGEEIGIPVHGAKARLAYRTAYLPAHKVIGVSEAVRHFLIASREVPAEKAVALHNPVRKMPGLARARAHGQRLRIAFVGRLEPVKAPLVLIEAMAILKGEMVEAEVVFIGDGSQRAAIVEAISHFGLNDRIELAGYVAKPEMILQKCHLIIQPSLSEGFGIAVAEGLSLGLPAIVTAHSGMNEIVEHGVNGWLIERPDPALVAQRIAEVERLSVAELAAVGERARQSVTGRFGIARYVEEIEDLYVGANG
jgi:glycosyltransferase involved in cell wall biosynthesis